MDVDRSCTVVVKTEEIPQINPFIVLEELRNIFIHNYPDMNFETADVSTTENETFVANKLFNAYSDILKEAKFTIAMDVGLEISGMTECNGPAGLSQENVSQKADVSEIVPASESFSSSSDIENDDDEYANDSYDPEEIEVMQSGSTKLVPAASVSMEKKKEMIQFWKNHPIMENGAASKNGATMKVKRELSKPYKAIDSYVFSQVVAALNAGEIVRASHLKEWGLSKYSQLQTGLSFNANKKWLIRFKRRHNLSFVGHMLGYTLSEKISNSS